MSDWKNRPLMNGDRPALAAILVAHLVCVILLPDAAAQQAFQIRLRVTTPLEYDNVPMDPLIDFARHLRQAGGEGFVDPNSIEVTNVATGRRQPHALAQFDAAGKGRVEWVIGGREEVDYDIRFRAAPVRIPARPQLTTPAIGVGDLLRYNAAAPRPITLFYGMSLVDLDGDGQRDLAGCWNYAYRAGDPPSGVVYYPRTEAEAGTEARSQKATQADSRSWLFGDRRRLRYQDSESDAALKDFVHVYVSADFADFNADGLVDLVVTRSGKKAATIYLNTGVTGAGEPPAYVESLVVDVGGWKACRAVDLDQDGALDLVVDGKFIRNANASGWPLQGAAPIALNAGREPCFIDLDGDNRLDAVCLQGGPTMQPDGYRVAWRKNLGSDPLRFGAERLLPGINDTWCSYVAAIRDDRKPGLLVQHNVFQNISIFVLANAKTSGVATGRVPAVERPAPERPATGPRMARVGRAESRSAVLALSDQAWPCLCDWDDDGDLDLLVGGGYGWPRIVINEGTTGQPEYAEPQRILADGSPIRFLRDEILGPPRHPHNMGYPYPELIDWDGDGLRDLVCANETNRIYWFRNVGTRQTPRFAARQPLVVQGFPDSAAQKRVSAQRAATETYPLEPARPFFWRTAPALADWNNDGRPDLITLSGDTRQATLFTQHQAPDGRLWLKRHPPLQLTDGRPIDDRIVARRSHWTEAFRPCDWDDDGRIDLIYSLAGSHGGIQDGGSIYLLRNAGTKQVPEFEPPVTMCCFGQPIQVTAHGPCARPFDYDGDGTIDLVTCVEWSVYPFYRHSALMMKARPEFAIIASSAVPSPRLNP